ncbi:MAG: hypothetical protein JWQ02_3531, partial [Capsulimonas sp.]|nr:hypothetical protein [Capsulimonas sp.]
LLSFRVVEHRVDKILLWSHEYPGRPIYSETLEVRLNGDALQEWRTAVAANPTGGILPPDNLLSYHWLSEEEPTATGPWPHSAAFIPTLGAFEIPLREAPSMSANLYLQALAW